MLDLTALIEYLFVNYVVTNCHLTVYHQMDQLRGRLLGISVTQHSYAREIIHMLLQVPSGRKTWALFKMTW